MNTATFVPPCTPMLRLVADTLDIEALSAHMVVQRRRVRAGKHVYRSGQPFRALFYVHAGFLRRSVAAADGRELVTGFPVRGELLGVESIGSATYSADVIALEDCEVVELAYPAVLQACAAMPVLQAALTQALAQELRRDQYWRLAVATLSANQRVAAFLQEVADSHRALGFSANHFVLRMSRSDIASFLALKHETVTRALSHLAAAGVITVERREIRIVCTRRLGICANGAELAQQAA